MTNITKSFPYKFANFAKYNEVASVCGTINEEMVKFLATNFITILSVHGFSSSVNESTFF